MTISLFRPLGVALFLAVSWSPVPAEATVLVLETVRDTTIFADNVDHASGAGDLFVGNTAGGQPRRALLRFDFSAVPAGLQVASASLGILVNRAAPAAPAGAATLHRLLSDWGEGLSNAGGSGGGDRARSGEATWASRFHASASGAWSQPGGDYATPASAVTELAGTGAHAWTGPGLVSDINGWLAAPPTNFGWVVIGDEANSHSARRFFSRESGPDGLRPTLVLALAPVPEPSVWALMVTGLSLLALGARNSATRR